MQVKSNSKLIVLTVSLDALNIEPVKKSFQQPHSEHTPYMHAPLMHRCHPISSINAMKDELITSI